MLITIFKLLVGAAGGAMFGYVLGRSRVCSTGACKTRTNLVFSIFAGSVLGAAVAWYWMHS